MRLRPHHAGFTLIEAVVAVAVLALTCVAVTAVFQVSLTAWAHLRADDVLASALDAESARLRALPFFRQAEGPDLGPSSAVAEVFPHARAWLDTGTAAYVTDDCTFVTRRAAQGCRISCTAQFVLVTAEAPEAVPATGVDGWAVWDAERPPATVLRVRLQAEGSAGRLARRELLIFASRPTVDTAAGGPGRASRAG